MQKNNLLIFYMFNLKSDHFGLKMKPYDRKVNLHVYNKIEAYDQHYFFYKIIGRDAVLWLPQPLAVRGLWISFSLFSVANYRMNRGAQWLSGRVLDS